MPNQNLTGLLGQNPYPGRGIVLGRGENGRSAVLAYFIMGRSANSRNRVFKKTANGGVRTAAADPEKLEDPSLIIYTALRRVGRRLVVTNGDQTDTVAEYLERGESFEAALRSRSFEPDAPNYTPRISGLLAWGNEGFSYKLSLLKSAGGNAASVQRFFYEYPQPLAGQGHLIHTYAHNRDGGTLPSFAGEPAPVAITGSLAEFGGGIWQALDESNKVALAVCQLTLDGESDVLLYNKYEEAGPV